MNTKDLLKSMGNCTQYPIITHNRKESDEIDVYV